jgi:macrodomain Ter protein organizer (MatP/YcbG family)
VTIATEERSGRAGQEFHPRRLSINLDPALHRQLKVLAFERESTMTDIVTDLLRATLEDGSEKGQK